MVDGIGRSPEVKSRHVQVNVYRLPANRFAVAVWLATASNKRRHLHRVPWGPPIPVEASTFPEALREAARHLQAVARDLER